MNEDSDVEFLNAIARRVADGDEVSDDNLAKALNIIRAMRGKQLSTTNKAKVDQAVERLSGLL